MTPLRGKVSIEVHQNEKSPPLFATCKEPVVRPISENETDPSKTIFYACMTCNGPMVPVATCLICKKTSTRQCTHCGKNSMIESHQSCQILISFGGNIVRKYSGEII